MSVSFYVSTDPNVEDLLELNVANGNFVRLIEILGYDMAAVETPDGWVGSFEGERLDDLRGKIVFVLDSIKAQPELDGGLNDEEVQNPGGCRIIIGGLRAGYFKERLETLLALVDRAKAEGRPLRYA